VSMFLTQLEFIKWIHRFRDPFLDEFFRFTNYLDTFGFWLFLIPIVWIFRGWKDGVRLFYLAMASSLTNYTLKSMFMILRPFQVDPSVGLIEVPGYSFPSGAAQTAMILPGILIYYWKSPWKWVIGVTYGLVLSSSRIFLGVHYPTDILGGWLVGLILLWCFISVRPKFEAFLGKQPLFTLFILSQAIPLALLPFFESRSMFQLCVIAMGIACGVALLEKRGGLAQLAKGVWLKVIVSCVLVGTIFLFYVMTSFPAPVPTLYRFFRVFAIGIWLPVGSYVLVSLANRMRSRLYG
jgi:undecaprenyl-diphosphatase